MCCHPTCPCPWRKSGFRGILQHISQSRQCLRRNCPHLSPCYRNSVRPGTRITAHERWSQTAIKSNAEGRNAWTAFWTIWEVPTVDLHCYWSCQALSYHEMHQCCWNHYLVVLFCISKHYTTPAPLVSHLISLEMFLPVQRQEVNALHLSPYRTPTLLPNIPKLLLSSTHWQLGH